MSLLMFLILQQQNASKRRFGSHEPLGPRTPLCGGVVAAEAAEAPKAEEADAYEISESLGPELCIEAKAGKEESGKLDPCLSWVKHLTKKWPLKESLDSELW